MRQGESYPLNISDSGLSLSRITKIEFTVGPLVKEYPGTVTYDSSTGMFSFPLSQAETLPLIGDLACEAKIKYSDNTVEVSRIGTLTIEPAMSKGVI